MTKKIMFVTGTRADFGKMSPLAEKAKAAGFEVSFFVTGMHMMETYGATKLEVQQVKDVEIFEFHNQRVGDPYDLILSKTILGFSDCVYELKPDLVVVHGDRVEAVACALVCATNYIRCAHVEGGEVSGTIDEAYRHCVTKLATYHFVCTEKAALRVKALGEEDQRIFNIGSPELDFHGKPSTVPLEQVKAYYEIPFDDYGVVTMHTVTSEKDTIADQARSFFGTLRDSGRHFVVIHPNNDPGSADILKVINELPEAQFRKIPSMRFEYFSCLMKNAKAVLGNSSAGVREAPFLGIPSLNVGSRQHNRSEAGSITNASCFEVDVIKQFLDEQWGKAYEQDPAFGKGDAAQSFANTLRQESLWDIPLQKHFSDEVVDAYAQQSGQ